MSSVIFLALVKTIVFNPAFRHSRKSHVASVYGLSRGLMNRKCLPARGAPLSRTAFKGGRGIGDGRRAGDELWVRAPVVADPPQSPQDMGHMGTEDAAIGVYLIDDDVSEVLEKPFPFLVEGVYREVEHIGVREDHFRQLLAYLLPPVWRRVAVIDLGGLQM